MNKRVQGLSYTIAESKEDNVIAKKGELIRGHEFHYTSINTDDKTRFGLDVKRGRGITGSEDGILQDNILASYIHVHACSHPNFAYKFTQYINEH